MPFMHRITHHLFRLPKPFLILVLLVVLTTGVLFVDEAVYAQPVGGKILFYDANPLSATPFRHYIGPPMPSIALCPMCLGPFGVGRWFLGNSVGGFVFVGGLGGF